MNDTAPSGLGAVLGNENYRALSDTTTAAFDAGRTLHRDETWEGIRALMGAATKADLQRSISELDHLSSLAASNAQFLRTLRDQIGVELRERT